MALIETYRPGPEGEDTSVRSSLPALADGGQAGLTVGRLGSEEARAFMKFDVALKPGWDVVNATLQVEVFDWIDSLDPAVFFVQAHRIGSAWDEDSTTWNDQPGVTGAVLSQLDVTGTGTYTFPIADALDAWNAGSPNNGIRLAYAPGGDARWFSFASSDASNPAIRPVIQVTWAAKAPNAPIVEIEGFPANESAVLSWRFSHDDVNAQQTAYAVEILRVSDQVAVLTQAKTTSSAQSITVPPGTLENGVEYQIRVQTWGPDDVQGPWSDYDLFTTAERPTVTILSPISGEVVDTSSYDVDWDYVGASPQAQFRLRLYETGTNVLAYDSGVMVSVLTIRTIPGLKDAQSYRAELEVWNAAGVGVAAPAVVTFTVDTIPPPVPQVEVSVDSESGVVGLEITNPAPGAGEVATDHNEVWRRIFGGEWVTLGSTAANSTFSDPTAAGGVTYEYRVVAHSGVGTEAEATTTATLALYGVWLHEPGDPLQTLVHLPYDGALGRMEQWTPDVQLLRFAGRAAAVADFGPQVSADFVDVSVQLPSGEQDRVLLKELAERRRVICYRDGQNRKVYGVITNLSIRDQKYGGSADFRVDRVDHIETGA